MSTAKRLCTNTDRDVHDGLDGFGGREGRSSRAEDCELHPNNSHSINEMPMEILDKILMDTVVAQALHGRASYAIKKRSRYDDNLVLVCPLWQQIVDGRLFKEIVWARIASIDPKALYKPETEPVRITGINLATDTEMCTMNGSAYTVEIEWIGWRICIYDIDFIQHRPTIDQESFFELRCTNRRPLPPVAGLTYIQKFVPSPKENCLYVQPHIRFLSFGVPQVPEVFKLTSDGTVSAHWYLDQRFGLYMTMMAVDHHGQHLVVSCAEFAQVFTSKGLLIATIMFDGIFTMPFVANVGILPDSTVIVNLGRFNTNYPTGKMKWLLSTRLVNIRAARTPDGLLEYEDLGDALRSGSFPIIHDQVYDQWRGDCSSFFVDSERCGVALLRNKLVVVDDKEMKIIKEAKPPRRKDSYRSRFHFDESLGLLFFNESSERWARREIRALHISYRQ